MEQIKFTVSIGLFDKDTKQQEIATIDAFKICSNICLTMFSGATITEAKGIYTHPDTKEIVIEPTLIIDLLYTTDQQVDKFIQHIKVVLNQNEVLKMKTIVNGEFK